MSNSLLFSVRLHEGWYHGSDFGPSPARLFQALVAGRGLSGPLNDSDVAALRFLEQLPAPTVGTPVLKAGQPVINYVPNNDLDAKRGDHRRIGDIRAKKRIAPVLFNNEVPFLFCWQLPDVYCKDNVEQLIQLANGIYQLGRGVDVAWGWAEVLPAKDLEDRFKNYYGPIRKPGIGIGNIECPGPGALDSLIRRYSDMALRYEVSEDGKGQAFRQRSKPRWQRISYESDSTVLHYDLMEEAGDSYCAWPQNRVVQLVEKIRDLAAEKLQRGLPEREADINATIVGRLPDGSNQGPISARIRIVPLSSIGFTHADRQIRRVVVEVPGRCVLPVGDIEWAFSGIVVDAGNKRFMLVKSHQNSQAKYYGIDSENSATWQTTTPIVLGQAPRRRIDPDLIQRSENDKKGTHERDAELAQALYALRRAVRQAGIAARIKSARLQKEPFDSRGLRVEGFAEGTRFNKHSLWHARIEFSRNLNGPVTIGDGRFLGLGVMCAHEDLSGNNAVFALEILGGLAPSADSVRVVAAVRRAVMSRVRDIIGSAQLPSYFTGHLRDGSPADSVQHPHLFFACDLKARRVLVITPRLGDRTIEVVKNELVHLRRLKTALQDLRIVRAGVDGMLALSPISVDSATEAILGHSDKWCSLTPYSVNRHGKRQQVEEIIERDVLDECRRRGLPKPVVVIKQWASKKGEGINTMLDLTFRHSIRGPLLLGRTRHKGGGLFQITE